MCGLTGLVHADRAHPVDRTLFTRMTDVVAHRGPDAAGYLFGDGFALGHRRLSIIDLSTGDQPMYNEDRSRAVIFNGEIYNFRELRADLEARGHRFRTASDTEAIVHAWEEYGEECVTRLRGMFALALWDLGNRRLLLARDRAGKKPLYYFDDGHRLAFASELKALLVDPSIKRSLDVQAIDDYLAFGAIPAPRTIYRGIAQLPPAHLLVWEAGRTRTREYWTLDFRPHRRPSEAAYLEAFEAVFADSVRRRLVSDVPLGAFLSGGVDSTAVVATMARESPLPVTTTTVAFEEEAFSEGVHARTVARALGTRHHEIMVTPRVLDVLPAIVWHLDEPFADSSAIPTYYVSRAARRHATVVLSGDGGDEIFAGYEWRYGLSLLERKLRRMIPRGLRRTMLAPAAAMWPKADRLPRPLRWKFLLRNLSLEPDEAYFHDMSLFTPADKGRLLTGEFRQALDGHRPFDAFRQHFRRLDGADHLSRLLYVDLKTWLANDILVKVDRMSMAHSLEVRSPLLDHTVIEFAASLPSDLKYRRGTSKYLLKRYAEQRAPASAIHRPKQGFSIPLARWLRGELRELSADLLFSSRAAGRGYFDARAVRTQWQRHQDGRQDHAHQLWALMMLEIWHRMFMDQVPPTTAPGVVP